jgi:hypothetical protein
MKYIKTYEAKKKDTYDLQYDFWKDFNEKKIRDIDHYLNIIHNDKYHVYLSQLESLFHWCCYEHCNDLALALSNELPKSSLAKLGRSLSYLDYKAYKTIMEKDDLYKLIMHKDREFVDNLIYYGIDDAKKLNLMINWGIVFTQKNLESASFAGRENIVKYLVSIGLDPSIKTKTTYDESQENCLDKAASHNKNPNIIKYFVTKLNIPVTFRHMRDVIKNDNLNALPILINSKNIIPDYAYSNNRHGTSYNTIVNLADVIRVMLNKNLNKYIKILLNREFDYGYNIIDDLPSNSEYNNKTHRYENSRIKSEYLNLAYWILSKYNGKENISITHFITNKHEKFWLNKMKTNPGIILKLKMIFDDLARSYEYQKIILDIDPNNLENIIDIINPKIKIEYNHLVNAKKYNL